MNQNFGVRITPKVSALYKLGAFNLRATYSEGFKTPTLKELHYRYIRQMSIISLNLGNTSWIHRPAVMFPVDWNIMELVSVSMSRDIVTG